MLSVYLEIGQKRVFAGAIEWPGWCRSGRDEVAALQVLLDYGERYKQILKQPNTGFIAPTKSSDFNVVERLEGNATTDFGAPGAIPDADSRPVDDKEFQRFLSILSACWQAFDAASKAAAGKELQKGPRGGGRELEGIARHVLDAQAGYLSSLGWKLKRSSDEDLREVFDRTRQAVVEGLEASARGEIPAKGPRGGPRWTPRYFVRRSAWHVLDHVWEIQDRIVK